MLLSEVVSRSGISNYRLSGDAELSWITADSRTVRPGSLFACMPSSRTNTYGYLSDARVAGAVAAIVFSEEGIVKADGLPTLMLSSNDHEYFVALGLISRTLFGDPTRNMRVIAVTGTNGKTTTAWMMRDALRSMGRRAAYLGTLGYQGGGPLEALANTTPFPVELNQILHQAAQEGMQDFVMEASSHALYERRSAGVRFDVGIFTNLSQDHLDFHGSMEAYAAAKRLLFTEYADASDKPFVSAFNVDDPVAAQWARELEGDGKKVLQFGLSGGRLRAIPFEVSVASIRLRLAVDRSAADARLNVGGNFNVSNALSAGAGLMALGYSLTETAEALESVTAVPGRFEAVPNDKGIGVIVDYAHTPDALEKLLASARELQPRRLITVFGCGGDRDKTKRPKMAAVASRLSDFVVVTSDNPRTEDPQSILEEVAVGIVPGADSVQIIDRVEAIRYAVDTARPGDTVVIAGKGHEDYQIIGHTKYPMDDRELARKALVGAR